MVSLSSCGGCPASLLDDSEDLSRLLERIHLTYCPLLTDEASLPDLDVILVEGAIRMEEDEEKLREARHKGRVLVAWGTCAALGGIPALANYYELESLLEASYGRAQDTVGYYLSGRGESGPALTGLAAERMVRRVDGLGARVRVDYFLPGCPPRTGLLLELVRELGGEPLPPKPKGVVCGDCGRKAGKTAPAGTLPIARRLWIETPAWPPKAPCVWGSLPKAAAGPPVRRGGSGAGGAAAPRKPPPES